ncbi:MAG: hypothetical protein MJ228_06200 [Bacilli bacterium]|nr:hypothetical protein [Bacilli bacterium]
METLFELIHQKNELSKGNVYKKTINGKVYYYHQYREDGKNITKKLSQEETALIMDEVSKRRDIESKIKHLLKSGNREIELSSFAKEYTGYVMAGDIVVAEFNKGVLIGEPHELCPYVIKRTRSLFPFLKSRSIDCGRTNSRLLRKVLNIKVSDETLISLCSYAASISDNYWFKPKHSKLKYADIAFDNDLFFDTALKGVIALYPKRLVLTPELTTNGGYEKGWRNVDGEWWLYKIETPEERYSEIFYSRLFEKLNLPTAHYELEDGFIKTKNFSPKHNFEPMISFVGENEDVEFVFEELNKIRRDIALDYLRLSVFDVVLNNIDRHNENCGILRDREKGDYISLAPNYDDNLCLISRNKDLKYEKNEGFLSVFLKLIRSSREIKNSLREIAFPEINEEILNEVNESISLDININFNEIKKFVLLRYQAILEEINK